MLRAMWRCWILGLGIAACADLDVSRSIGARCDLSGECNERCLAPAADYPGGFCSISCDTAIDCATSDTTCVDDEGGVCLFQCNADANCAFLGAGWRCVERDARGAVTGEDTQVKVCRGG